VRDLASTFVSLKVEKLKINTQFLFIGLQYIPRGNSGVQYGTSIRFP
jgi:hypothetical protein